MSAASAASILPVRALALVAGLAHTVDRVVRWPLHQVRLGFLPGGLLAGGALLLLAGSTATATLAAYDERPVARPTTLREISRGAISSGVWVAFDGLFINEPHAATVALFSNGALVGEVERLYYVVRDPDEPDVGFLVRSAMEPDDAVVRTVIARLTEDPAAIASALPAFGDAASGLAVDETLLIDESASEPNAVPLSGAEGAPLTPSALPATTAGSDVLVAGRVVAQLPATEGDAAHLYLLADRGGSSAVVLRSPHPPDALPVRLDGTIVSDPFNIGTLLEDWQPEDRHAPLEISEQRLLALGVGREFEEPSWLGAALLALLGALLIGGMMVGYPVFRGRPAGPSPDEGRRRDVAVRIVGSLPTPHGAARLDGEQGNLEWLPVAEVARTRWRYWGAQLGDLRGDVEAAVRAASHDAEQLVIHSPVESVLWPLPSTADGLQAEPGDLFFVRSRAPGIRLRATDARAFLVFGDAHDRDLALREIAEAR